jgi:nucleotide-binding universal stress UspA family protein
MRVLVAIDGSEVSHAATQQVLGRPWPAGSAFLVLTVVPAILYPVLYPELPGAALPEASFVKDYGDLNRRAVQEAEDLVNRSAEPLRTAGFAVETSVERGDPRVEIVDKATSWGADLVIVGSHGRAGIKRLLLGSVAEYVIRHASCSVEVARPTAIQA